MILKEEKKKIKRKLSLRLVSNYSFIVGSCSGVEPDLVYLLACFDDLWGVLRSSSVRADERDALTIGNAEPFILVRRWR